VPREESVEQPGSVEHPHRLRGEYMGVNEIHAKLYKPADAVRSHKDVHGLHIALDIASFKARAFRSDAPQHFRPDVDCRYGFKAVLTKLLSFWSTAVGNPAHLHVVLDDARFPLKAAEHARRSDGKTFETRLEAAIDTDVNGNVKDADSLYKELSMVACPPLVDAWIIAHCRRYGYIVHVAPCEADSMCGRMALDGDADAIVSYDGDLGVYKGVTHLIIADAGIGKQGQYWHVHSTFGDTRFFSLLGKLYSGNLPEFNKVGFPLRHYFLWAKGQRVPPPPMPNPMPDPEPRQQQPASPQPTPAQMTRAIRRRAVRESRRRDRVAVVEEEEVEAMEECASPVPGSKRLPEGSPALPSPSGQGSPNEIVDEIARALRIAKRQTRLRSMGLGADVVALQPMCKRGHPLQAIHSRHQLKCDGCLKQTPAL